MFNPVFQWLVSVLVGGWPLYPSGPLPTVAPPASSPRTSTQGELPPPPLNPPRASQCHAAIPPFSRTHSLTLIVSRDKHLTFRNLKELAKIWFQTHGLGWGGMFKVINQCKTQLYFIGLNNMFFDICISLMIRKQMYLNSSLVVIQRIVSNKHPCI